MNNRSTFFHDDRRGGALRSHWRFLFWEGVVLLVLGVLALIVPVVASVAAEFLIGWLLLVSGIAGLISTLRMRRAPGLGFSLLSALAGIVAGGILIAWPLSGVLSLTLILTAFLTIEGVVSILYAMAHRRDFAARWGMLVLSGVVDLVIAAMIFAGLPATASWAIGVLVGVNLLVGGSALIAMGLAARPAATR